MANLLNKQTLSSKIVILGLVLLLAFLGKLKYSQWRAQQEIEKQKEVLQQQADSLQKKNNDLNQSLQYLNSPDFKERVARQDLGLKKEGEQVYSFGDPVPASDTPMAKAGGNNNPSKWWNYFFETN